MEILAKNQRMKKKINEDVMILMYIFMNHDLFSLTSKVSLDKNKKSLNEKAMPRDFFYKLTCKHVASWSDQ